MRSITPFEPETLTLYERTVECMKEKQYEEAEETISRLILHCPYESSFHLLKGECLNAQHRFAEAVEACRRSLALNPQNSEALLTIAMAYLLLGEPIPAKAALDKGLVLSPDRSELRWHRAFCNLSLLRFAEGFEDYEYGYVRGPRGLRCPPHLMWDGKPTEVLFVHSEQGLGDQIQFSRFLRHAKEAAGGMVAFECSAELLGLFDNCADLVFAQRDGAVPIPYTKWISMVSLPRVLGISNISGEAYFDPPRVNVDVGGCKVGFVWSGNPAHPHDKDRSLTEEEARSFEGLAAFGALQPAEELPFDMPRINGSDMGHTAAAMAKLDLIVTVDTAPAHLAGALGKECWMIAPRRGEWRWGLEGSRTPWYDSVEVFRCPGGDRSVAIEAVQAKLRARYPEVKATVREVVEERELEEAVA